MRRREFFERSLGALALAALASACRHRPQREEALSAIVLGVVVPDTAQLVATSDRLVATLGALAAAASPATLAAARAAFGPALLAWKRALCFRNGPIVETSAVLRSAFWPVRPVAVDAVLGGNRAIDDTLVAELGVDARGMYALEYLLFPLALDDAATLRSFSDGGGRRGRLAEALGRSVAKYASLVKKSLGDGSAFAQRFASGGQASISALVAQMARTIENLAAHRLGLVLTEEETHILKPSEVEGWPSGMSQEVVLAELTTIERLYRGGGDDQLGLSAVTREVAPAIDDRIKERFTASVGAVKSLDAPLERVVKTHHDRLVAAAASTKALELALKVDLVSALGLTLTFQAGDGD